MNEITGGLWPALLTPFEEDGKPALNVVDRLVDLLVDQGLDGLYVLGSTGQGPALTVEERKTVAKRVLERIGMTPTEAVRLLYRQIALRKEFPLELRVPNKLTASTLNKSDREEDIETFDSPDDMVKSWNE